MRRKNIEVTDPLVWEVLRTRSLGGACTLVTAAIVLFCFEAWLYAAFACVVSLIMLSTFLFSSRGPFENVVIGFFFLALLIVAIAGSGFAYLDLGLEASRSDGCGESRISDYRDALYFSVITWTTVGYGDIKPSPSARLWAAGQALYGTLYTGLLIAYILKLLAIQGIRESQLCEEQRLTRSVGGDV